MFRDMVNIFFLMLAELLEFVATILSLPARLVADISSFCYGASRAFENNDSNEEQDGD